jgi:hypothetical protein
MSRFTFSLTLFIETGRYLKQRAPMKSPTLFVGKTIRIQKTNCNYLFFPDLGLLRRFLPGSSSWSSILRSFLFTYCCRCFRGPRRGFSFLSLHPFHLLSFPIYDREYFFAFNNVPTFSRLSDTFTFSLNNPFQQSPFSFNRGMVVLMVKSRGSN